MKKVLIIGKRGFIGKSLNKFLKLKHNVKLISFKEALNFKQIDKYNFIINSSINRSYIEKKYNKKFDNDLKIAERINNIKTIYVFLSSRKVYKAKQNINEGDKLSSIVLENDDGQKETIEVDTILAFFGLIMKLGPIADWGLNIDKKTVPVNTQNFETNKKGIFAIGDICSYPGKERLILSGFHEAALASVECFKRAKPNEKYRFQFTTSSKEIQERLGRKPK